jgi:competence protein ComEC
MKRPKEYIAIIDVGHGNSTVIATNGGTVVIDTGRGSALLEFLTQERITKIDHLILSHADQDHIGALAQVLATEKITIGTIHLNTDSAKKSQAWKDLAYELQQNYYRGKIQFKTSLTVGDTGQLNIPGVVFEILAPNQYLSMLGPGSVDRQGRPITSNTISAVIRVLRSEKPIALLLGDLDSTGLDNLRKPRVSATSPVLIFPHHGGLSGGTSLTRFVRNILKTFKPSTIVFSIGRFGYSNPDPEVIAAIRHISPNCRVICTQLSQHCTARLPACDSKHLTEFFSQGREKGLCCGGTIIIDLNRPNQLFPSTKAHRGFIKANIPTGLCFA